MELLLCVARGPAEPDVDLLVTAEPTHTVDDLAGELRPWAADTDEKTLVRLPEGLALPLDATLEEVGLVSGERLGFRRATAMPAPSGSRERTLHLEVTGGQAEGFSTRLEPGAYTVGRSPAKDQDESTYIGIHNQAISRPHLDLQVGADLTITIAEEEDVKNPLKLDGVPQPGPFSFGPGQKLDLAGSILEVRSVVPRRSVIVDQLGQVPFHRTPHRPPRVVEVELPGIAKVPVQPDPPRFSWPSAVIPVLGGVVLAVAMGEPRFLFFTLLAPLSGVASFVDSRKRGRLQHARDIATFRDRVAARRAAVTAAIDGERTVRHEAAPDLADLRRRAELRSKELWCRGRDLPEFLLLKLGSGDVPSLVRAGRDGTGDDHLMEELEALAASHETVRGVPVCLPMAELGAVAVTGALREVRSMVKGLVLQAVCLHSPEDLVVAAAGTGQLGLVDWLKWLPHTRATGSPISGPHLATDQDETNRLLRSLIDVAEFRTAATAHGMDRRWPWVLVVLDRLIGPDPRLVSQLLTLGSEAGISVVWLSDTVDRVPPECAAVIELRARNIAGSDHSVLWFTDPERPVQRFVSDAVDDDLPQAVGLSLAPLRDASASTSTSSIPRVVPLFSAHQIDAPTEGWLAQQWALDRPRPSGGYAVEAVIGMRADGPMTLDLVEDGPHTLIGGTSGAGKSELLQALVAGLVVSHSPRDVNLMFIDFKGGSASEVFKGLPHLAGRVTDLDESLALRAQVSLRAELRRRVADFSALEAKDMADMRRDHLEAAPPSLVIVIDEFATLVKQMPDFVAEIIDIAQRGRSYGVHLVLATQRPSAAVDDNILANTNLRISLRMLDRAESVSVLNSPEAADIPVPLKGRAIARMGPGQLVEFQSAYCSTPFLTHSRPPVLVRPFVAGAIGARRDTTAVVSPTPLSQLDVLISMIEGLDLPRTRQVWNDVLPQHLSLEEAEDLTADDAAPRVLAPGRAVLLGGTDDPAAQAQYPTVVDLDAGGGLLVFGAGDSGKTSVLRTVATSAAIDDEALGGGRLAIFVLDFSSGELRSLECLPQCRGVGTLDDLEATTRILEVLSAEVAARRAQMQEGVGGAGRPTVLLLIDGYPSLVDSLVNTREGQEQASDRWFTQLQRVLIDGRQVGIHAVVTADRAASVRNAILAGITTRLVLRQVDDAEAKALGAPPTRSFKPGGGYLDGMRVQVAQVRARPADPEESAVRDVATTMTSAPDVSLATSPLSEQLEQPRADPEGLRGLLGRADISGADVEFDLTTLDLLVSGPPMSGKSSALVTVGRQLRAAGHDVFAMGAEDSGLRSEPWGQEAWTGPEIDSLLAALAAQLSFPGRSAVLLVDDVDLIKHPTFDVSAAGFDVLRSLRVVASTSSFGFTQNPVAKRVRDARQALYLQPASAREVAEAIGLARLPNLRLGLPFPAGRGLLVRRGESTVLQTWAPAADGRDESRGENHRA